MSHDHDTAEQWTQIEDYRDQLQARLDRLDAFENLDVRNRDDAERERLGEAITVADDEIMDAEIAFHRALGDHDRVAELQSDWLHADLIAANAVLAGEDEDDEEDEDGRPGDPGPDEPSE